MQATSVFPIRVVVLCRIVSALAAAVLVAGSLIACASGPQAPAKPIELPVFPPPPEPARFHFERSLHSSADVVPDDKDGSLRRLVTGETRVGEGLAKPYAVAARDGRIYIGDTVARMVLTFDLARGRYKQIGTEDPGALRMPFGNIAIVRRASFVVDDREVDEFFIPIVAGEAKTYFDKNMISGMEYSAASMKNVPALLVFCDCGIG